MCFCTTKLLYKQQVQKTCHTGLPDVGWKEGFGFGDASYLKLEGGSQTRNPSEDGVGANFTDHADTAALDSQRVHEHQVSRLQRVLTAELRRPEKRVFVSG